MVKRLIWDFLKKKIHYSKVWVLFVMILPLINVKLCMLTKISCSVWDISPPPLSLPSTDHIGFYREWTSLADFIEIATGVPMSSFFICTVDLHAILPRISVLRTSVHTTHVFKIPQILWGHTKHWRNITTLVLLGQFW